MWKIADMSVDCKLCPLMHFVGHFWRFSFFRLYMQNKMNFDKFFFHQKFLISKLWKLRIFIGDLICYLPPHFETFDSMWRWWSDLSEERLKWLPDTQTVNWFDLTNIYFGDFTAIPTFDYKKLDWIGFIA